jgi:hypothetical protein
MASVIRKNSMDNLKAFSQRFGLAPAENMDKDGLALMLKETVLEHPEYILYIYSREALLFLIDLWGSEEMVLTRADWTLVRQLQLMGFLDYSMSRESDNQVGTIYLVKEAKDNFFFFLRTRQSRREMERYDTWERLIRGLLTFYGIISFNRLYFYLCQYVRQPIDDENLHDFLASRISLWSFGSLVLERNSGLEYYENFEVKVPEKILDLCHEDEERDYKKPRYEELLYVGDNNGFGLWDGISDLADILMEQMGVEYYQTVVVIKSSLVLIQNGEGCARVLENIIKYCPGAEMFQGDLYKGVHQLYQSVPIYSLKGWSRGEQKEGKKEEGKGPIFTVLKGGKKPNTEK